MSYSISSPISSSSRHQPLPPNPHFPRGYPVHLIIKPDHPDWLCVYCQCVCRSPVELSCGPHLACYSCFMQEVKKAAGGVMSCPAMHPHSPPGSLSTTPMLSVAIQTRISKYQIRCPMGCGVQMEIGIGDKDEEGIMSHLRSVCPNQLVECQWKCQWKNQRNLQQHHEAECDLRTVKCSLCCNKYQWKEMQQHIANPPHCALCMYCPNNCYRKIVTTSENLSEEGHREEEPLDSTDGDCFTHISTDDIFLTVMLKSDEAAHLRICPLSKQQCFCHNLVVKHTMEQHLKNEIISHVVLMNSKIEQQWKHMKSMDHAMLVWQSKLEARLKSIESRLDNRQSR